MSSFYYMPSVSHSTIYYVSSEGSRVICSQHTKISILVSVSEQVHDFVLARHHYHIDLVQVSQVCARLAQDRPPSAWILIVKTATEKIMPRIACSSCNRLTYSRAALDLCLALDTKLNIAPWVRCLWCLSDGEAWPQAVCRVFPYSVHHSHRWASFCRLLVLSNSPSSRPFCYLFEKGHSLFKNTKLGYRDKDFDTV